ncbi:MAG: hypothetical protein JWP08_560, partial [Bryobacterales bacterium]|nr:hypothetical protein [Bryobacterales bacterium]
MLSDVKFAIRALGKTPGFTAAAILILALGIGATTAVFSVVEAVLLRPLPYPQAQELVSLRSALQNQFGQFNVLEFRAYRDQTRAFTGLAAIVTFNTNLVDRGNAQIVQGLRLSANSFDLLGVQPAAGRLLRPDDDRAEAPKVAVLGHGFWQRVYGGRQDIIGRAIVIDGEPRTVVGVLPADFLLPVNGYHNDVCVPLQVDNDPRINQPASLHVLMVIGRLKSPDLKQAATDADLVLADLRRDYPLEFPGTTGTQVTPLMDDVVGDTRPVLTTLLGVVGSLLLLACVNLTGLLLVRGLGRQRELAIRAALGGSKNQLMRLLFAECAVLAVAGGAAGFLLSQWSLSALTALIPADVPRAHDIHFNGLVLGFAGLVSVLAGVVPGIAPLWLCSWIDLRDAVNTGGRGNTGSGSQLRLRHVLA